MMTYIEKLRVADQINIKKYKIKKRISYVFYIIFPLICLSLIFYPGVLFLMKLIVPRIYLKQTFIIVLSVFIFCLLLVLFKVIQNAYKTTKLYGSSKLSLHILLIVYIIVILHLILRTTLGLQFGSFIEEFSEIYNIVFILITDSIFLFLVIAKFLNDIRKESEITLVLIILFLSVINKWELYLTAFTLYEFFSFDKIFIKNKIQLLRRKKCTEQVLQIRINQSKIKVYLFLIINFFLSTLFDIFLEYIKESNKQMYLDICVFLNETIKIPVPYFRSTVVLLLIITLSIPKTVQKIRKLFDSLLEKNILKLNKLN